MTSRQRAIHSWLWFILGPLLAAGMILALLNRRPLPLQETPVEPSARVIRMTGGTA